jgi:hypothetical protein
MAEQPTFDDLKLITQQIDSIMEGIATLNKSLKETICMVGVTLEVLREAQMLDEERYQRLLIEHRKRLATGGIGYTM